VATRAYVLVETAVGRTRDVAVAVKALEEVKAADMVTGPYEIILKVEARDLNAVGDLVTREIHPISGVNRTVTCLSI
jgi:DNA-binding Lrp family transcriptional regulator